MKTRLSIQDRRFFLNGAPVYSELSTCPEEFRGLLLNARFIQGVFDDNMAPERFRRFGRTFDPDRNTDALIAALPAWYGKGLRAFTVGFQGGGPCSTALAACAALRCLIALPSHSDALIDRFHAEL